VLNEGIVTGDTKTLVKSEMVRQLRKLSEATPEQLERAVFEKLTGGKREDIDWDFEDNKAGYFLWTKTFDGLITELVDDGYFKVKTGGEEKTMVLGQVDPDLDVSKSNYPKED
jgi:hypothetical protein